MMMLNWVDDLLAGFISVLSEIVGAILNIIWIILCQLIYPLLSLLFNVFTKIYSVDIIPKGSENIISDIYGRITIIITIVMTFYIVFEFVKYTVSPDMIGDKEKGAMPLFSRIIIVILLLAFVPTIFETAKELQQRILDTNVIPKVILGPDYIDDDISGVGREFVGDVFSAFIRVDCNNASLLSCEQLKNGAKASIDSVKSANFFMTTAVTQLDPGIEFSGLLALIFGVFMLYVVFLYCKDIALRQVQFLFLQVIAPVAIISYIGPKKDGMFQKWLKQCTTTYLDLFIRIAVLYFIVLISKLLGETYQLDELQYAGDGRQISITVYLFLVAGLLMFLKRLPKLLEELFPKSGAASIGFGFSAKERQGILGGIGGVTKGAARAIGAGFALHRASTSIKEGKLFSDEDKEKMSTMPKWKRRLYKGATYADVMARAGVKGFTAGKDGKIGEAIRSGQKSVEEYEKIVSNQGSVLGHDFGTSRYQTTQARLNLEIEGLEQKVKSNDSQSSMVKSAKTAQDAGEDRAKQKITAKEQKIAITTDIDATTLKNAIGLSALSKYGISIDTGKTTSEIYSMLEAKTNSAKATSEAFNQELVKAEVEGDVEKINRLKTLVEQKEAEAVEIQTLTEKTLKELSRYAFTRALRGDIGSVEGITEKGDEVLASKIATVKQVLENLRRNASSSEEAKEKLRNALTDELFNKVMNYETEVNDFDTFDAIQGRLTNYASSLSDENSSINEQIRIIKESEEYQKSKANTEGK